MSTAEELRRMQAMLVEQHVRLMEQQAEITANKLEQQAEITAIRHEHQQDIKEMKEGTVMMQRMKSTVHV